MIADNKQVKVRQTRTKIGILKPTTLSLLFKIEEEDKNSYKTIIFLHVEDELLSKYHIITTQKYSRILLSAHKLHSPHPFI